MKRISWMTAALMLAGVVFTANGAWMTSYDAAVTKAKETGKPVLANFTGSDWCPACMALTESTFDKESFKDFASKNLVLLDVDFPKGKPQSADLVRQNEMLAQKYEIQGFPTLVLIDGKGEEIARHMGFLPGGPDSMIAWIKQSIDS